MIQFFNDLLGTTLTATQQDIVVGGCVAIGVLAFVVTLDFVYKIFLAFVPRKEK